MSEICRILAIIKLSEQIVQCLIFDTAFIIDVLCNRITWVNLCTK